MAARYFVGNATNWSSTSSWSTSSGGASGATVPTASDDVLLDSNSPGNLTIDIAAACRSIDCTGFTHTLAHSSGITLTIGTTTVNGSFALKFNSSMTYSQADATATIVLASAQASTTLTVDLANQSFLGAVNLSPVVTSAGYQLVNGFTTTGNISLGAGNLDTNSQTCSWGSFSSSNTNARILTLGSSAITLTGTGTVWSTTTATSMTMTTNTAVVTMNGAGGIIFASTISLNHHGLSLAFTGSGLPSITGNLTTGIANVTRIGTAVTTDGLQINNGLTCSGTLTLTGNSLTNRLLLQTSQVGTAIAVSAATVSITNCDFRDITAGGTAIPWTGTSLGNALGNSNITFDTAQTNYWVGGTGNWSDVTHWANSSGGSGSSGRVPLCQDLVKLDANSFSAASQVVTDDMPRMGTNIDWTGAAHSPSWKGSLNLSGFMFGNVTFVAGMTTASVNGNQWTVWSRTPCTLTTNGVTMSLPFQVNCPGTTFTFADNYTQGANSLILTAGIVDCLTHNVNMTFNNQGQLNASGALTKTLNMGNGTWTFNGGTTSATVWTVNNVGSTLNCGTSTIVFGSCTGTRTFAGGGFTYHTLQYITAGSTGQLVITGSNTFAAFSFNDTSNVRTLTLTHGTTTTITGQLNVYGNTTNAMTLNSDSVGNSATISATAGVAVNFGNVSIQDSTASGGANFADVHGTSTSGNTGWTFPAGITAVSGGGNWSSTATWSTGVLPTAADYVLINSLSGAVTIDSGSPACRKLDCSGYVGTLTHTAAVTLTIGDATDGSMCLSSGLTYTLGNASTSALSFVSTNAACAILTGGKTLGNVTFNGAAGAWTLQDTNAMANITIITGTLNTNSQTCTWVSCVSAVGTKTLTLGASAITLTASSTTAWNILPASLTVTANTAVVTLTGTTAGFQGGFVGTNYNGLSVVFTGPVESVMGGGIFANLTRIGTAEKGDAIEFVQTGITITGTLTLTGNSITNRLNVQYQFSGTSATITAATVSLTNVDFQDIIGAGLASPFMGTSLGDRHGNSGITFTTPVSRYRVGSGGNWSDTTHWSTSSGGQVAPQSPCLRMRYI